MSVSTYEIERDRGGIYRIYTHRGRDTGKGERGKEERDKGQK
jgi:hypothetical protein